MHYKSHFKKLQRLQVQQIITLLGLVKTAEWCDSFVIVPNPKGTLHLCLDPARCNQVLIRLIHRGPTLDDIFPKLTNVHYLNP